MDPEQKIPIPQAPQPPTVPGQNAPRPLNIAEQNLSGQINLAEELATPQLPKYTIRTMAQDLERARKEGVSPVAATKAPPPPPMRSATPKITGVSTPIKEAPMPPTVKVPIMPPSIPTRPSVVAPPAKKPSRISFAQLNLLIGIIAVAIILIGSIGFSYWWFFVRVAPIEPITMQPPIEEEKPEEKLPPQIAEPELPQSILSTDQDTIIDISTKIPSAETEFLLESQISASAKTLSDKKLARILTKYQAETEKSYLAFQDVASLLQFTVPDTIAEQISSGEFLAYSQNGEIRYGFAAKIVNSAKTLEEAGKWEKTMADDLKNIYIDKTPIKPENAEFKDFSNENFIVRYLNLPTPDISMTWGISDTEKIFVVATSKDMMYKIIGYKEAEKPALRTFPSGTLVRAKGDTKIYRIIDDKKLWIPTVKAFIDSGYPVRSEVEILPEELAQYQDAKYIKLKDTADIYEIKGNKKYLVANPQTLPQNEIKIATYAEFIAYPIGQ